MHKLNCALLIDDDGAANYTNFRILKNMDIAERIETAVNGEKALNFIQFFAEQHDGNSPGLILLDLKMPVLDGYEFLEYFFRKNLANIEEVKVIVLSASPGDVNAKLLQKFPSTHYVVKPLTEDKLREVLNH